MIRALRRVGRFLEDMVQAVLLDYKRMEEQLDKLREANGYLNTENWKLWKVIQEEERHLHRTSADPTNPDREAARRFLDHFYGITTVIEPEKQRHQEEEDNARQGTS